MSSDDEAHVAKGGLSGLAEWVMAERFKGWLVTPLLCRERLWLDRWQGLGEWLGWWVVTVSLSLTLPQIRPGWPGADQMPFNGNSWLT